MADAERKALVAACERAEYEYSLLAAPDGKVAVEFKHLRAALNQIEADGKRIAELEAVILSAADFLANAPLESNICCCGEPIEVHGYYSGHSPVDAAQYAAEQWVQQLRAALGDKG